MADLTIEEVAARCGITVEELLALHDAHEHALNVIAWQARERVRLRELRRERREHEAIEAFCDWLYAFARPLRLAWLADTGLARIEELERDVQRLYDERCCCCGR
jgi:hypothetical protein